MPEFTVDMTNTEEQVAFPKSSYEVKTIKVIPKKPTEPGKYLGFVVLGEITEGEFAGKRVNCYLTTNPEPTEGGMGTKNFMLVGYLEANNIEVGYGEQMRLNTDEWINSVCIWNLDIDPNNDKQNRVSGFAPAD